MSAALTHLAMKIWRYPSSAAGCERRGHWSRESRIEYDVGAVRYPALLPLSTASRVVTSEAPSLTLMVKRRGSF